MSINYLLKRTSTADKRPTAAQLDVGEIALNYEGGDPGLYFEDSNGAVRKVGPVTVGGTAPNASPAGQAGNSIGELWLDNSGGDNVLKVYDGSDWQTASSANVPAGGSTTQVQFNSSGALTGDANFTFDADNDILSVTTVEGDLDGPVVFSAVASQNLTKGQVVYIDGISGNTPTVDLARANSSTTMPAFGVVSADISSGATGTVVSFGQVGNLDTSTPGFSEGETLYVSATSAGELVNTAPTGEANLIQNVGRVERVSSTVGRIAVAGAGRSNATPNLDDGKIFIGNGSNQAVSSTLTAALSAQAGISSAADAVAVTIDSSERVGIGTTAPSAKVEIAGDGANSSRVFIGQANDTADGTDVTGYRARGTLASPTALQSGDAVFKLFAQAHNGSAYLAAGNMGWAASDGSGNSTFSLKTRVGSSVADRLTINSSGNTGLTGDLTVTGDINANGNIVGDSSTEITGIDVVSTTYLTLASVNVNASATELNYLDGSTPGTATASNALVLDASKDITGINSLNSTSLSAGTTGSPFQASATNDVVTKSYADATYAAGTFGIQAHASFDASAGGSFDWATDKINEGNITSVSRTAVGKFTVTFDTDFSSANYTAVCSAGGLDHAGITAGGRTVSVVSRSAGSMDIVVERADDAANDDCEYISIMVIGTLS